MQEQRKILLRMKTAIVSAKKYPRIFMPRDIIKGLGLTQDDKAVYITLYEDKTITIEKAEEGGKA